MKKYYLLNLVFAFLISIAFYSCSENIIIEYTNPNDPYSDNYPTPFSITNKTENSVSMEWIDNTEGKSGFWVERSEFVNSGFITIAKLSPGITSYTDNYKLSTNKNYYYRVKYVTNDIVTRISNISKVFLKFAPPFNLKATEVDPQNNIFISWEYLNSFEKGFIIEQKALNSTDDFVKIAEVPGNETSYTIKNPDQNKKYSFRVCAVSDHNKSDYSNSINMLYGFYYDNIKTYSSTYYSNTVEFSPKENSFFSTGYIYTNKPFIVFGENNYSLNYFGECAKYHPGGNYIAILPYSGSTPYYVNDTTIRIINSSNGALEFEVGLQALSLDFSRDGSRMVCCSYYRNEFKGFVAMYDFANRKVLWKKTDYYAKFVRFSPKNNKVIAINTQNRILTIDPDNGTIISSSASIGYDFTFCEISPDGNYMAIASSEIAHTSGAGPLEIWDLNTMQKIYRLSNLSFCAAFTRDSKYIAANSGSGISFFRLSDGEFMGALDEKSKGAVSMSFNSTDSRLVASMVYSPTTLFSISRKWMPN